VKHGSSSLPEPAARFAIGRMSDNELVFFDEPARESWIIYPPRSRYSHVQRPTSESVVVEHHPWAPMSATQNHVITAAEGCADHGIECGAYAAIKAAAQLGWDAFK
jgi:hypothetical protein